MASLNAAARLLVACQQRCWRSKWRQGVGVSAFTRLGCTQHYSHHQKTYCWHAFCLNYESHSVRMCCRSSTLPGSLRSPQGLPAAAPAVLWQPSKWPSHAAAAAGATVDERHGAIVSNSCAVCSCSSKHIWRVAPDLRRRAAVMGTHFLAWYDYSVACLRGLRGYVKPTCRLGYVCGLHSSTPCAAGWGLLVYGPALQHCQAIQPRLQHCAAIYF